jgi:mycofactocin system glycosyltransferase
VRIALDTGVSVRASGRVLAGGSPWRVVQLREEAVPFVSRLREAGSAGAVPQDAPARSVARSLLDRGFAHPVVGERCKAHAGVDVVVPVLGSGTLDGCLESLRGLHVIVVDDGSVDRDAVRMIANRHGATFERHGENRGPAAARNTGARVARADLVAFVDADCRPQAGWLAILSAHFDDPHVAAVAPRVIGAPAGKSLLARYEVARSPLDMGARPGLARPGGRLSFLPTATLVVRRSVVLRHRFDERLRTGEDVDLVWRLSDAGWLVRYEPAATVVHARDTSPGRLAERRVAYGTSAGALAHRHGGRLAPARLSGRSLASIGLVATGHPIAAAANTGFAAAGLHRRLAPLGLGRSMAAGIVGRGLAAEAAGLGQVFRREWWPVGALMVAFGASSKPGTAREAARFVSLLMGAPLALEWVWTRAEMNPLAYVMLRLLDDAAYGTGVAMGSLREGTLSALLPEVRLRGGRPPRTAASRHAPTGDGP